jgi:transposase
MPFSSSTGPDGTWHTTGKLAMPDNITPIFLPSRAPELNPVENVWQYLRQNWLSNTVFEN